MRMGRWRDGDRTQKLRKTKPILCSQYTAPEAGYFQKGILFSLSCKSDLCFLCQFTGHKQAFQKTVSDAFIWPLMVQCSTCSFLSNSGSTRRSTGMTFLLNHSIGEKESGTRQQPVLFTDVKKKINKIRHIC